MTATVTRIAGRRKADPTAADMVKAATTGLTPAQVVAGAKSADLIDALIRLTHMTHDAETAARESRRFAPLAPGEPTPAQHLSDLRTQRDAIRAELIARCDR